MGVMGFGNSVSVSTSQTLSNVINFNPNMQFGGSDNEADLTSSLDQRASSEALNKDELKMAASVGVGVAGGSGSGGAATLLDSSNSDAPKKSSVFDDAASSVNNLPIPVLIGGVALIVGGGGYYLLKKKKKRK